MANPDDHPLDEVQWSSPAFVEQHGIHDNSVLHYFAESPFFDRTSNNAVLANQAQFNYNMLAVVQTRERMEAHLQTMSGLEYIVAERPKEMGRGAVWIINKQTRRKRPGEEDEVIVHACYYVVDPNIFMAPTLADILTSRIQTISAAIRQVQPLAEDVQTWTPSGGYVYQQTTALETNPSQGIQSKEGTPMPDGITKSSNAPQKNKNISLQRLADDSYGIHMKYGGEYIDENPITGRPGDFHLSSTGRKEKLTLPLGQGPLGANVNTKLAEDAKKDSKGDKAPKTPTTPKLKRRKSKTGVPLEAAS